MADNPLNVIVVGHNNQTKCEVANAMFRLNHRFKQFNCSKLNRIRVSKFTHVGNYPYIITTPCLATPLWNSEFKRLKEDKQYENRCFVYVKDMSTMRVDDVKSIQGIQGRMEESVVVVIPYLINMKKLAEEKCSRFDRFGWKSTLLKVPISEFEMEQFSKTVFRMIESVKPSTVAVSSKSLYTTESVGAKGVPLSKSVDSTKVEVLDEEAMKQLQSVFIQKKDVRPDTAPRPCTPPLDVNLTKDNWQMYKKALTSGLTISYHTRVNIVGYHGSGKTTLVRRLQKIDFESLPSTECLEIDKTSSRCIESDDGRLWETHPDGYEKDLNYQRMAASMNSVDDKRQDSQECFEISTETSDGAASATPNINDPPPRPRVSDDPFPVDDEFLMGSDTIDDSFIDQGVNYDWEMYQGNLIKKAYLQNVVRKQVRSPGMRRYISYWDFAGQATYYTTHQAFMAPAAVYLLVVDLSKPLDLAVEDSMEFRTHSYIKTTILDAIRFWAGSIKSFASDENNSLAPVIVVGTHADLVGDSDAIERIFEEVKQIIGESELSCIALDNTEPHDSSERLHELRDRILDKALGILEKEVRANWIDLEYMIILEKGKMEVIISLDHLRKINRQLDNPLNEQELQDFLEYEHCNGFLMYFNTDSLKDIVILQPSVLVKFINILLRRTQRGLVKGWSRDGTFDQTFLDNELHSDIQLEKYKNELLRLLIHLKIVFPKDIKGTSSRFFMPCLLEERPSDHPDCFTNSEKSPLLRISFSEKLLPPAFFHSLVVSCLFAWKCDEVADNRGRIISQVFYHYCRFKLTDSGGALLEMFWSECHIFLRFIHLHSKRSCLKRLDCLKKLETIRTKVQEILETYKHNNIEPIIDMECPCQEKNTFVPFFDLINHEEARCSGTTTMHMVNVSELSDWIMKEEDQTTQDSEMNCLPDKTRRRRMTEQDFVALSMMISANFEHLFILLGLDLEEIQRKQREHRDNVATTILYLFHSWSKKVADDATVDAFLKCLPKIGIDERYAWEVFQ